MSHFKRGNIDFSRRTLFTALVGGGIWAGLIGRLAQLQLADGEDYAEQANENRIRFDAAPAQRGVIYDRFGRKIASNKRNFYLSIVPEDTDDLEGSLEQVARYLPLSDKRMERLLREASRRARFNRLIVADDLSWEMFSRLNVHMPDIPGIYAEEGVRRSYPYAEVFAHLLGYVGKPTREELDQVIADRILELDLHVEDNVARRAVRDRLQNIYLHPDMRLGKQGLEEFAEPYLRGESGFKRVAVNAQGRVVEELPSADIGPRPGGEIVLSLDVDIQKYAADRFGEETGSAIVMHIETGDLVAMVSTPGFDPNDFVSGISHAKFKTLLDNKDAPLYNKSYDGRYPPGSTFKMVTAAAALEQGVISPTERVYCNGRMRLGRRYFHCWKREGHGSVDLHSALKGSCDVYFYEAARRVGVEAIADMARRFGFGERYDLGITGGTRGIVPDSEWKLRARNEKWVEGETLNYGIGQGYLSVSPLQLAVMTARIARGQAAALPRLVIGGMPTPLNDIMDRALVSDEILDILRAGMFGVTSEPGGTALRSGDLGNGIRLAGKTGTAQVRRITSAERASGVRENKDIERRLRDHALFVAYAPADNPEYVCVVVVDHGGSGSRSAAPIARDILKRTIDTAPMSRPVHQVSRSVAGTRSSRGQETG